MKSRGTGKTPAFARLIRKPTPLSTESFTYAGLLQNLSDATGHLMIGTDEILQQLESNITGLDCFDATFGYLI